MAAYLRTSRPFHDVQMADEICLDVGVRIFDRITHPGLSPKMDDPVDATTLQSLPECLEIGKVPVYEVKIMVQALQFRDAILFKAHAVIVIEAIKPDNPLTAGEQSSACVEADEARRSSHE